MNSYTQRSTATLQAQRAFLMAEPRNLNLDELELLRAIDRELQSRNVLSLGLDL